MDDRPKAAPDYTAAFIGTMGLIFFMGFFTLAAIAGTMAVALAFAAIDLVIRLIDRRKRMLAPQAGR